MPVHDWTKVEAGIFHAFHHDWITEISRALNAGRLPDKYYALPEQIAGEFGPDVLTLSRISPPPGGDVEGGIALELAPPKVDLHLRSEASQYADKAKAVVVRHVSNHRIVAMVEIVSPGNKSSRNGLRSFVYKAREAMAAGVHLLIVDLFPPSPLQPQGIHSAIWGEDNEPDFTLPDERPLTCASYLAGGGAEAFLNFVGLGQPLPARPLFLTPQVYVETPLEETYQKALEAMPKYWQQVLSGGRPSDQ